MRNENNYSGIERDSMLIIVGDKHERADTATIYEEISGHSTRCIRCGADLKVKPWMKNGYYELCIRCENQLNNDLHGKKPWTHRV